MDLDIDNAIYLLRRKRRIDQNSCWIFQGSTWGVGYGQIRFRDKHVSVHRFIAYICLGLPMESKLEVRHKCDVKLCFNPVHLEIGTHADNMHDASIRMPRRPRGPNNTCIHGHEMTEENTYHRRRGKSFSRACIKCMKLRNKENPGHR
jgi:hypothetical protein